MKIAEGIEMFEIHGSMFGTPGVFLPTLIWDESEVVLIDTGLPGQRKLIREAVEKAGVPFDRISKIIITHHDTGHIYTRLYTRSYTPLSEKIQNPCNRCCYECY